MSASQTAVETALSAAKPRHHDSFEWLRSEPIESLNLVVEEYRHVATGAVHYHLDSDSDENVFLVALRTMPMDDTGVAHILEHTALCGSKHYPVRDPFFMMIRRSLNTFMNAFTSSDWTAYPFASQNRKDFFNLLDVYLDAVFYSNLHELDFRQEGWRLEFAERDDPETPLEFKGVVYNEMKGAMSSPVSVLWQELTSNLFPTTTYHYNSGGDPEHIPDLSYEALVAFYRKHYHPSNAVFMTFGNIPVAELQQRFHDRALREFDRLDEIIDVSDEKRYESPRVFESVYAADEAETGDRTHIVMAWLLGRSIDTMEALRTNLMTSVLLDNSASPLLHALETTDLGSAPSPLCGTEDSNREMAFMAGIEGSRPEHAEALEKLILDTLEEVAQKGVPQERIDAALHQLELHQREIKGDHYPYGLQLILGGLPAAIHRGDPVAALNLDAALEQLRAEASQPDFIQNMVRRLLLDNRHRIRLTMKPDTDLARVKAQRERDRLDAIRAGMSDDDVRAVIDLAERLAARQAQEDDPEILPKVTLDDVPADIHIPQGQRRPLAGVPATLYARGTNGLAYQQIVLDLPQLDDEQIDMLPQYLNALTELGVGDRSYTETQAWQDAVSGGVNVSALIRAGLDDVQQVQGKYVISGKALVRNHGPLTELLRETLLHPRFDELPKIRELVAQSRIRRENSVTGNGHVLAMRAASSGLSGRARLSHVMHGLEGIRRLKALDDSLDDADRLEAFAADMARLHETLSAGGRQFLLIGEEERLPALEEDIVAHWRDAPGGSAGTPFSLTPVSETVQQCWLTNTQVNFCARAYPAVPAEHPDAAAFEVLGGFLRNGFLHSRVREQGGAYGGGASFDADIGAFRFYSYRDPRFSETLEDFDRAIEWLLSHPHEYQALEEAILGVVSSIDKPGSPAGEAQKAFYGELFGRTAEQRRRYRARILAVTLDDLKRVGEAWLKPERASTAVISHAGNEAEAERLGLQIVQL